MMIFVKSRVLWFWNCDSDGLQDFLYDIWLFVAFEVVTLLQLLPVSHKHNFWTFANMLCTERSAAPLHIAW